MHKVEEKYRVDQLGRRESYRLLRGGASERLFFFLFRSRNINNNRQPTSDMTVHQQKTWLFILYHGMGAYPHETFAPTE